MTLACGTDLEWLLRIDADCDPFDSHVFLYRGFDLTAAGIYVHEFHPCPFCDLPADHDPCLILTEEEMHGRTIMYVCCGNCGTRGPWGRTESSGLAQWNSRATNEGLPA